MVYFVSPDDWEEMCIVAVEKQVAEALERQEFRDLMASVGLTPPSAQVRTDRQTDITC